jgi:hypothetical protein
MQVYILHHPTQQLHWVMQSDQYTLSVDDIVLLEGAGWEVSHTFVHQPTGIDKVRELVDDALKQAAEF